jgi:glucosamine-6-phosphate deaminase
MSMGQPIRTMNVEKMRVEVYASRAEMGRAVAEAVATKMKELLSHKKELSVVFAAADSQKEFLESLAAGKGIDWGRVTAFHMDEYLGVNGLSRQSFGRWLRDRLFDRVRPGTIHYMDGMAANPEAECERYAALLRAAPLDIACLGIGENGHLAFNDPPVADFADSKGVKVVEIDEASRVQQSAEGNFPRPGDVPKVALTMTIPALLAAPFIACTVPGPRKARAVKAALNDPVSTACPATALRGHAGTVVYLDPDSSRLIDTAIAGR